MRCLRASAVASETLPASVRVPRSDAGLVWRFQTLARGGEGWRGVLVFRNSPVKWDCSSDAAAHERSRPRRSAEIADVVANAMAARCRLAPRRPHALHEGADMRARCRRGEIAHDLLAEQADLLSPRVEIARAGREGRVAAVAPFADPAQRAIELAA